MKEKFPIKRESKGTDTEQYILSSIHTQISNADNKANIALAASGVLLGIIMPHAILYVAKIDWSNCNANKAYNIIATIALAIGLLALFVALIMFMLTIMPRFIGGIDSIVYYEIIQSKDNVNDFINYYNGRALNMRTELIAEIYYNSQICSKKMHKFKSGLIFMCLGMLLSFSGVIVFAFIG